MKSFVRRLQTTRETRDAAASVSFRSVDNYRTTKRKKTTRGASEIVKRGMFGKTYYILLIGRHTTRRRSHRGIVSRFEIWGSAVKSDLEAAESDVPEESFPLVLRCAAGTCWRN
ncbi:hypothetical protein F2P81_019671 [Scophthalmus maximus]|uniref:Uncharacterized protein n=1 Tax=Scophthalmus maximus TaxID=52904 RepID=A0A6A4SCF5_SCOMX|nr:hypothetical protein F2P81_019671 [Scophthalmus maximus]